MAHNHGVPGVGPLPDIQVEVLAACDRGEVWLPNWPRWHNAEWEGHRSPTTSLLPLHRRDLVQAMPTRGGGPCRAQVRPTADGKRVLKALPSISERMEVTHD